MKPTTKSPYEIILRPIITEKSMRGTEAEENLGRKYAFAVAKNSNKYEIAWALEQIQKDAKAPINVTTVNVVNVHGHARVGRFFRRANKGTTASYKKAYITLQPGQQIELIEGV